MYVNMCAEGNVPEKKVKLSSKNHENQNASGSSLESKQNWTAGSLRSGGEGIHNLGPQARPTTQTCTVEQWWLETRGNDP